MPDIYMLDNVSESDFVTAVVAQQGYPPYMGRIIALLAAFATFGEASRVIGQLMSHGIIDVMDFIHPKFGPDQAFVDELRFAEEGLFGMPDDGIYIDFNRYDAMGRAVIVSIMALLIKLGLQKQIVAFAGGWLAKMVTSQRHKELVTEIGEIRETIALINPVNRRTNTDDSARLQNMEKYLHMLGDSLRTNKRIFNDDLEFRSSTSNGSNYLVPEWPQVE